MFESAPVQFFSIFFSVEADRVRNKTGVAKLKIRSAKVKLINQKVGLPFSCIFPEVVAFR